MFITSKGFRAFAFLTNERDCVSVVCINQVQSSFKSYFFWKSIFTGETSSSKRQVSKGLLFWSYHFQWVLFFYEQNFLFHLHSQAPKHLLFVQIYWIPLIRNHFEVEAAHHLSKGWWIRKSKDTSEMGINLSSKCFFAFLEFLASKFLEAILILDCLRFVLLTFTFLQMELIWLMGAGISINKWTRRC